MPDIQDYPQIYSAAGTRLAVLDKAYDVITTDQIITDTNGASTLNFNLPLDDPKQNLFDIEDEVHVAGDIFIIRTIQPGWDSGTLVTQVYAEAKWYDIAGFDPIQPMTMTGATAISVMEALLQSTDWSPGVVDVTTVADFSLTQVTNPLAAIMGMPAVFGGELEFDDSNKAVSLRQQIGGDNGLFYAFGKNLQSNQRTVDSRNLYTRMRPYGAQDSNNNPLTIASANNGVDYIENYSWYDQTGKPRKIKCYEQTNDKITDPTALKTWGQAILAQLCMPKITYTMQVVIDKNQGIPQIGDTVRVYDPVLKMTTTNRVAQRNYNVLQPWLTTVQLSTALYTSSDQTTAIANDVAVQMAQQKSFFQVAVDQATKDITGASGGYVRLNPSKNPSEILIMDTPDINTATKVWRWNSGGLGYSKNGYNGPYELAMTQSGQIVADFITTGILKAIEIQGVSISGSSYYMENGGMKIWLDQNGFHMNYSDFDVWIDENGFRALKGGNSIASIGIDGSATFQGTVITNDPNGNTSSKLHSNGLEFYKDGRFLASLGRTYGSTTQGVSLDLQDGDYLSISKKIGTNPDGSTVTSNIMLFNPDQTVDVYGKMRVWNQYFDIHAWAIFYYAAYLQGNSLFFGNAGSTDNHIYFDGTNVILGASNMFRIGVNGNYAAQFMDQFADLWARLDMHSNSIINCTGVSQPSQLKLKTDIRKIDPKQALKNILDTDVVRYRYKKDHEQRVGLIIDNRDNPEFHASKDFITEDGKCKKDDTIVGELMLAVKAQQQMISNQQAQIDKLSKHLAELEANCSSHKKM